MRVDLADFAGQPLLLRWHLGCDQGTWLDRGWWLDDIRVTYGTRHPAPGTGHPKRSCSPEVGAQAAGDGRRATGGG